MALNKADLIDAIQYHLGFPKNQSTELVEQLI